MHRRDALVRVNEVGGIPGTDFLSRKNWGDGSPRLGAGGRPLQFSIYRATVPLECGVYRFRVDQDDGARVYLNDQLVIDEWHIAMPIYTRDVGVTAGNHKLKVEYYEEEKGAAITVDWQIISRCDTTPPGSTITYPAPTDPDIGPSVQYLSALNGTASDQETGVRSVQVSLARNADGLY